MAAKVKVDKEFLIKHRFWLLLPCIGIAVLIGWICVLYVRDETETFQKDAQAVHGQLLGVQNDPAKRNDGWIKAIQEKKIVSLDQKNELWLEGYDQQNSVLRRPPANNATPSTPGMKPLGELIEIRDPIITWPAKTAQLWEADKPGQSLRLLDFGEPLQIVPIDYRNDYLLQFNTVLNLIEWYDETTGKGAVRVLGGSGNHRSKANADLLKPFQFKPDRTVLSEEAWTLQEELAIRREMLRSLAQVIDHAGTFSREWQVITKPANQKNPASANNKSGSTPAPAKSTLDELTFYNHVWTWTLPPAAEIKNEPTPRRMPSVPIPPTVPSWQGWELDLQLVVDGNKVKLEGKSINHSTKYTIPKAALLVYFIDGETKQEKANPVELDDAGELPPTQASGGATTQLSERALRPREVEPGSIRISRVVRKAEEPCLDQLCVYNQNWVMDVRFLGQPNSSITTVNCTLYNRGPRRTPVPNFNIEWSDGTPTRGTAMKNPEKSIRFSVDALDAGDKKTFTQEFRESYAMRKIMNVRQTMDWRNTPIKRMDVMEIGLTAHEHSDRTKVTPLVAYKFSNKDPKAPAAGAAASEPPALSANHEVMMKRYLEVSHEVRRLPVCLVLVTDASAVNEVLTGLSNSRLRFQVTQAVWNRTASLGKPISPGQPSGGTGTTGTTGGSGAPSTTQGGGSQMNVPSPPTGAGSGMFSSAGSGSGSDKKAPAQMIGVEDDSAVVVLQIYGMVTLYESPDAYERIEQARRGGGR